MLLAAFLFLVEPLLLVAMPCAPSSALVPSSVARSYILVESLLLVPMACAPSRALVPGSEARSY